MRGLVSSAFIVLVLAWAVVDLPTLLNTARTFLDVFMVGMQKLASAAQSAVS
ncbi:MAG: hypothetical protein L0G70_08885 [Rubrobacter sp.]|nr:hypothetical protein [Rubrobacter sp.]